MRPDLGQPPLADPVDPAWVLYDVAWIVCREIVRLSAEMVLNASGLTVLKTKLQDATPDGVYAEGGAGRITLKIHAICSGLGLVRMPWHE
jgi:hypothetical protein